MKYKPIWILLGMLLFSSLSMVNAQETPNITFYYNLSEGFSTMGNCDSNGIDILVCTFPQGPTHPWEYGIFNTISGNLTLVDVGTIWRGNSQTTAWDVATCHYYSDNFYCAVQQDANSTFGIVELSGDYTTNSLISTHPQPTGNAETIPTTGACDLKPGTDEIYCWTNIAVNPVYNNMWKYDIGDNTWTLLKNIPVPLWQSPGLSENLANSGCTFRDNTDELWCYGGGEFSSSNFNYNLTIYDTGLNTTTTIQNNGFDFIGGAGIAASPVYCRWHNDVLYCYGIADESLSAQNDMWYYNATSDTQGWINGIINSHFGGRGSIGDKDYLISGLANDIGTERFEVFEIEWSSTAPVTPSAPAAAAEDDENIGGNIIALQNLQKATAKAEAPVNPITQFILNLRAAILRLFGIEG